jgi:hypothetical protein
LGTSAYYYMYYSADPYLIYSSKITLENFRSALHSAIADIRIKAIAEDPSLRMGERPPSPVIMWEKQQKSAQAKNAQR